MLITSFGVSIAVQAIITIVVSARARTVPQPSWTVATVDFAGLTLPAYQVVTVLVTAVALFVMVVVLKRTNFGLAMRGAAENFQTARLLGVRANRMVSSAFAISGLLAGVGAVLILARTGGTLEPTMGLAPVLKAFVAIVIGGIGSLSGAVVGGLVLGVAEVMLRAYLPGQLTGLTDGILFALVVIVIVVRPEGVMGLKARLRT
jgi:branched-chain amino acid transport system permease protein